MIACGCSRLMCKELSWRCCVVRRQSERTPSMALHALRIMSRVRVLPGALGAQKLFASRGVSWIFIEFDALALRKASTPTRPSSGRLVLDLLESVRADRRTNQLEATAPLTNLKPAAVPPESFSTPIHAKFGGRPGSLTDLRGEQAA